MSTIRVCVADADVDSACCLADDLNGHDYEARVVEGEGELLKLCRAGKVDIAVVDIDLPGEGGMSICRKLKADPATADLPVVVVASRGSNANMREVAAAGAADMLFRPYNLPIVMVRLDSVFQSRLQRQQMARGVDTLLDSAYTDPLTGLRNKRYLLERLQEEVEKAHRYDYPVSCAVFDIDNVTAEDEELGPVSMDDLLAELGMAFRDHSRGFDVVARYDGTMFAAVLPHTQMQDALNYANKILDEVEGTVFSDPNFPTRVSMRAGLVSSRNGTALGAEFVLGEALRGLLQGRGMAKNRVVARDLAPGK